MNNLLMGRLSNLQPAGPGKELSSHDFSSGFASTQTLEKLVFKRPSKAGVFDEQGNYRVVDENQPTIGFDPYTKRNGLIVEPSSLNCIGGMGGGNPLQFTPGDGLALDKPVLGPDNKMSAFRVSGTKTEQPPSINQYTVPEGTVGITCTAFVKYVPGGETEYAMGLRNVTTNLNLSSCRVEISTGRIINAGGANGTTTVHMYPNGWCQIIFTRTMAGTSRGDVITAYFLYDGNRVYKEIDLWYHQLEMLPFATSLIIPGQVRQARLGVANDSYIAMPEYSTPAGFSQIMEISKQYQEGQTSGYFGGFLSLQQRAYVTFNGPVKRMSVIARLGTTSVMKNSANDTFMARCGMKVVPGKLLQACVNGANTTSAGSPIPDPLTGISQFRVGSAHSDGRAVLHWVRTYEGEIDLARWTKL